MTIVSPVPLPPFLGEGDMGAQSAQAQAEKIAQDLWGSQGVDAVPGSFQVCSRDASRFQLFWEMRRVWG